MAMRMSRYLVPVCSTVLGVVAVGRASATMQTPTFKGATRTVAVYATVANAEGRLVPDLARDAFTILDNGKPQPLTVFASDSQPITVVMLLDRSGSMLANFTLVEQAAEHFVAAMLPTDKARIGSFSNGVQVDPPDFTSDHDRLLKVLRTDLQPEGPTPLWNAVDLGITALLREQGRRVILVFTDGVDSPGNLRGDNSSLKDVMTRAEEEDVMVYAIGLAGQNGPGSGVPSGGGAGGGFGRGGARHGGIGQAGGGGSSGRVEKPDAGLPKLAGATGGGYFELTSTDDLATTFSRVVDELHHQYALGFAPTILDAKRHTLEVRVAGTGLTLRARKSYLAVEAGTPAPEPVRAVSADALEAALSSIGHATGTRIIRTWIGISRGESGRTTVTFVWEPAPKTPGDRAAAETPARVSILASGPDEVAYFKGTVPEASAGGSEPASSARFDVNPGPLQLRLSVEGASSNVIASETRTMTVPDLTTPRIALGTPQILRARTLRAYQQMKGNPEAMPVATREFSRTDRLLVRLPVYGPDDRAQLVSVRLLNQSGYVMEELSVTPAGSPNLQEADVPVANLPPGEYLVQIKVAGDGDTPPELVAFRLGS